MTEAVIERPMVKKHTTHTSSTEIAKKLNSLNRKINDIAESDSASNSVVYKREGVFTSVKFLESEEENKK